MAFTAERTRYASVGLVCAVVHNTVMITGDYAGAHYAWSTVVSYVIVVVLGYLLHTRITFRAPGSWPGFVKYAVPMAGNFPASLALMFALSDLMRLPIPIAAPLGTVLLFIANYAVARWAILGGMFRNPTDG